MKKAKLTKTALKRLKDDLKRYNRYLPTLRIKKQLLQTEARRVKDEMQRIQGKLNSLQEEMDAWVALLGEDVGLADLLEVGRIRTRTDNIAGVDLPVFIELPILLKPYDIFATPLWLDRAITRLSELLVLKAEKLATQEQYRLLNAELRLTSQRVNLFEKVKIPETEEKVRGISIYLADQQAAAIGWARIAKKKIQEAA